MYMKNHPDTLVAYVKYFGKVRGKVTTARMTAIDTKVRVPVILRRGREGHTSCQGMSLAYQLKNGENGQVHVPFNPPLAGYDDVKPRLLSMKADAQEDLGMVRLLLCCHICVSAAHIHVDQSTTTNDF